MGAEENKALVGRFLTALTEGILNVIDELVGSDFVDRSLLPGQGPTREDFKRSVAQIVAAFSVTSFTIDEQIAEGDRVVTKYRERSVIKGEFAGLPPTGTEENFEGIYIHRISEGKIVEEWSQANTLNTTLERLERERVEQELRVARRIQQALLPQAIPQLNGWRIVQHYQPAREVGGDFYDFLLLADGYVGLVIGDVSGKGVPAAVLMANTQSVLRTRRPALCTETNFAPLSAPITHRILQHELQREEPLLPDTSLNRGPREASAAIVSS